MKRPLAITTAAALALSLAACGADMTDMDAYGTGAPETVTSTDTMYNGETSGVYGTGAVAGAMNRAADDYRYGTNAGGAYTARNNGGYLSQSDRAAADRAASGRYQLMLENGRVHDKDGYLLDGENAHYNTF